MITLLLNTYSSYNFIKKYINTKVLRVKIFNKKEDIFTSHRFQSFENICYT